MLDRYHVHDGLTLQISLLVFNFNLLDRNIVIRFSESSPEPYLVQDKFKLYMLTIQRVTVRP